MEKNEVHNGRKRTQSIKAFCAECFFFANIEHVGDVTKPRIFFKKLFKKAISWPPMIATKLKQMCLTGATLPYIFQSKHKLDLFFYLGQLSAILTGNKYIMRFKPHM